MQVVLQVRVREILCYCDVVYVENRRCDEFCEAIFFDSMCDEVGWWTGGIL